MQGHGITKHLNELYRKLHFENVPELKLIYLAPHDSMEKMDTTTNDAMKYFHGFITLNEFANSTEPDLSKLLISIDKKYQK